MKKFIGKRFLSGITPSGDGSLHIGNYLGAVRQFIELSKTNEAYLMVADLHALTTVQDRKQLTHNTETLILNELALLAGGLGGVGGLQKIVFFRQSDVPEHTELQSILNNTTPLGLIKRAHAYKDKLQGETTEEEINMGLFNYPILMAADILLYKPDFVPVGRDQKQHIEITRDIAERFNKTYGRKDKKDKGDERGIFKLPEPHIPEEVAVVLGTDGKRKMSKSLGNTIAIFEPEEVMRKQVMGTYTDPTRIHATDPGHVEGNMVFAYLDFFGKQEDVGELKRKYEKGAVADVEVKDYLLKTLIEYFAPARKTYEELKQNPGMVKKILTDGAQKARAVAGKTMREVREAVGLVNQYSNTTNTTNPQMLPNGDGIITIDEFAQVELRVGEVLEAKNKEGSEKLIRLVVDVGDKTQRIIFTAVRGYGYTPDDFIGKQFFFITNLAPRKMMDEESQGMILAVDPSTDSGQAGKPIFISADGIPVGAKIR